MSDYVAVPYDADPDSLADAAVDYLRAAVPGWEPASASLEVFLIAALARITSELTTVAATVPTAIFRSFGQSVIGLPPLQGAAASLATTWTARDNLGHTIPAGTQAAYRVSGDTLIVFEVAADTVIPPGSTSYSPVTMQAVEVGVGANGVPAGPLELIDSLAWVSSVAANSASSGGVDAETDDAYLARLTAELRLQSPRPILPDDFATLARRVTGVYRALAVDGYNPVGPTTGNERMVCLFPVDSTGAAVSSGIKTALQTYLDGLREVSFVVNVADPTSATINVVYSVHVATGYDSTATIAACTAAIQSWLSPATWGGGDQSPPVWTSSTVVRRFDGVAVLSQVPGVAYVASLTLNGGTSDVTMSGVAPLPTAGTVTGTAV